MTNAAEPIKKAFTAGFSFFAPGMPIGYGFPVSTATSSMSTNAPMAAATTGYPATTVMQHPPAYNSTNCLDLSTNQQSLMQNYLAIYS